LKSTPSVLSAGTELTAAAAVNRLLDDQVLRRQMAERGRRLHLEQYNYDHQFRHVVEFIRGATGAGSNRKMAARV
jgi:hypothetical protein